MTKENFIEALREPVITRCATCVDTGVRDEGERFGICECLEGLRERASGGNFLRLMNEARQRRESGWPASGASRPDSVESVAVSIASTRCLEGDGG